MKLKYFALAALMATGSAHAAIDAGTSGNGELFFNIWDGSQSYSFDLNKSIDAFETDLNAAGKLNLDWTLDGFGSFLAGIANDAALRWNITATDISGARRILATYTPPKDTTPLTADSGRSVAGAVNQKVLNGINLGLIGNAGTFSAADAGYTGNAAATWLQLGFDSTGTLASSNYADGLGFMRVNCNSLGTAACGLNEYMDEGMAVNAWLDGGTLHIAAVPEPETYALMLAGLGLVGFMARRKAA